ncbi:MAG: hypothetical protein ABI640_04305 [Gammaproteobacteria bacterium]
MRILIALCVVVTTPALAQLEILPAQTSQTADASLGCDQLQNELSKALANPAVQTSLQQGVADAAPPAEEGKKKGGGLFKKFGQAAGGLGAALGGGRGVGAALGTAQAVGAATGALGGAGGDVGTVAQAAGALGNLGGLAGGGGDKLASIGAATQMAGALSGGRGGGAGAVANAAVAANAMQGRGGLEAGVLQALATQQLGGAKVASMNIPARAVELFQLGQAKKCAWVPTEPSGAQK